MYDYVLSCWEYKDQLDKLKETTTTTTKYKSTINIPLDIFQIIKPVFTGIADTLLSKCLQDRKDRTQTMDWMQLFGLVVAKMYLWKK